MEFEFDSVSKQARPFVPIPRRLTGRALQWNTERGVAGANEVGASSYLDTRTKRRASGYPTAFALALS